MARISGIDLPSGKRLEIALTYIYGIGRLRSIEIIKKAELDQNVRVRSLTEENTSKLRTIIEKEYVVEGELRGQVAMNIKRLIDIKSYRGLRHKKALPVRGQRTKTNSRTRKSRKAGMSIKK